MLMKAQQLSKAEQTLRQLFAELSPLAGEVPGVYDTLSRLAEVGAQLQKFTAQELQDQESQSALSIADGI